MPLQLLHLRGLQVKGLLLLLFLLFGRYPRVDAGPDLLILLGKGSELHADVVDHVVEHFLLGTHLVPFHVQLDL